MKSFKDYFIVRESVNQNKLSSPSNYLNGQQLVPGDKLYLLKSPMGIDLGKKMSANTGEANKLKNMLVGVGRGGGGGIIMDADEIIKKYFLSFDKVKDDFSLDELYERAYKTNDINVIDRVIDLYYNAFASVIEKEIDIMEEYLKDLKNNQPSEDKLNWFSRSIEKLSVDLIPMIRKLEEAKIKSLSITGQVDTYVGEGPLRRSNSYDRQIKNIKNIIHASTIN